MKVYNNNQQNKFKEELNKDEVNIILTPPPNLTGKLHLGHILNMSIQDFILFSQKIFFNIQYIPVFGFDHAGLYAEIIAKKTNQTNNIIPTILENNENNKKQILKQIEEYNFHYYKEKILYTLSEESKEIVKKTILYLKEIKIIKEKRYIVNVDIQEKTALSDLEVNKVVRPKKLFYIKYFIEDLDEYIVIATTSLNTIEDDHYIAFNPDDFSKIKYKNKYAINPINKRKIPIITSKYVEINFGSGFLKVTPHFSKIDFKIATENNFFKQEDKKIIYCDREYIFNQNSILNGYKINDPQTIEIIFQILNNKNFIVKTELINSLVYISKRTFKEVIHIASRQAFVDMQLISQNYKYNVDVIGCLGSNEINRFLQELELWCITRQNSYGHEYDKDNKLDTWFSSSLWIDIFLQTFNINHKKQKIKIIIITAYDIMFYWIYRMIYMSQINTEKQLINCVIVHGLVCDKHGQKISKSKNNQILIEFENPEERDHVRLYIILSNIINKRIKIAEDKKILASKVIQKIKNITIYIQKYVGYIKINCKEIVINKQNKDLINTYTNQIYYLLLGDYIKQINNISKVIYIIKNEINILIKQIGKNNIQDHIYSIVLIYKIILKYFYCLCPFLAKKQYELLFDDEITDHIKYVVESPYNNMYKIIQTYHLHYNKLKDFIFMETSDVIIKSIFSSSIKHVLKKYKKYIITDNSVLYYEESVSYLFNLDSF